jgi:hypothetical protein
MDGDAVDRLQQRHLDKIMPLDEAADRQRRGDHQQRIAGIGIGKPVQQAGPGQGRDIGERWIGDVRTTTTAAAAPASYRQGERPARAP